MTKKTEDAGAALRISLAHALNGAEANLKAATDRAIRAAEAHSAWVESWASYERELQAVREKVLATSGADRIAAVERYNELVASRNEVAEQRVRAELGTAQAEKRKAVEEHEKTLARFERAMGLDAILGTGRPDTDSTEDSTTA